MTTITPPRGKGTPPQPVDTIANLDKAAAQTANLNFKVTPSFHSDFAIFAIRHGFKSQTALLHEAFALIKSRYERAE